MNINNREVQKKLILRLKRIEGQVHGVQEMLYNARDCHEIMTQLSAIHEAVQATSRVFLQEYASACLARMDAEGEPENLPLQRAELVREMISLLDKTP